MALGSPSFSARRRLRYLHHPHHPNTHSVGAVEGLGAAMGEGPGILLSRTGSFSSPTGKSGGSLGASEADPAGCTAAGLVACQGTPGQSPLSSLPQLPSFLPFFCR